MGAVFLGDAGANTIELSRAKVDAESASFWVESFLQTLPLTLNTAISSERKDYIF
jgi:hypothetical protein